MRTTKRFTPDLLERYREAGRGLGTYERYVPWHRVSRNDPASSGRSHLLLLAGRPCELLSDKEWVAALFCTMVPELEDLREQFPLGLTWSPHELGAYDFRLGGPDLPGTLEIASEYGLRHPRVNGNGRSAPWVMTTDLLLTLRAPSGALRLLAVSCKSSSDLTCKRTLEKLRIERHYWLTRGAEWLLVTPDLYEELVALTLRNAMPWGLGQAVSDEARMSAADIARRISGYPLCSVLEHISCALGDLDVAQRAFWQAVWSGLLPLDLRRGWRPHLPTVLCTVDGFLALNPIASRRSSWIN
jgi:hypothetical protein